MGIRIGIGNVLIGAGGSFNPSQYSDLNYWGVGRSGLTIPDTKGSNDAAILPAVAKFNDANYMYRSVANFGHVTSGYIEARVYHAAGENTIIFGSADESTATHYFYLYVGTTNKPTISTRSATGSVFNNAYVATNAISEGWHTLRFESSGTAYTISVDGTPVAGSAVVGSDDGSWLGDIGVGRDNITFGYLKHSGALYSGTGLHKLSWFDFNGTSLWHFTGAGLYEYDIKAGANVTWTGTAHIAYDAAEGSYLLDTGYSLYTKPASADEYVPYSATSTPYDASAFLSGYTKQYDQEGGGSYMIAAPCLIDFDPLDATPAELDNYDRSNTTICTADARAGADYDASNPYRWRARDILNPDTYYAWKNAGYETLIYARIDHTGKYPQKAYEFIGYSVAKNAAQVADLEAYCGIDDF